MGTVVLPSGHIKLTITTGILLLLNLTSRENKFTLTVLTLTKFSFFQVNTWLETFSQIILVIAALASGKIEHKTLICSKENG